MKCHLIRAILLAVIIPAALSAADSKKSSKPGPPSAIMRLGWLAGHWRMEHGGRVIEAQWMAPAGGMMPGMSRTIAKGKVQEYEFLQIREGPGGMLFYVSQSAGQSEVVFQVSTLTDAEVVFENPGHDFPSKLSYTLQPDGVLLAAAEGPTPAGATKRIEYAYARVQP